MLLHECEEAVFLFMPSQEFCVKYIFVRWRAHIMADFGLLIIVFAFAKEEGLKLYAFSSSLLGSIYVIVLDTYLAFAGPTPRRSSHPYTRRVYSSFSRYIPVP